MRNKHPGICYRCGETVAPGDGHFERVSDALRRKVRATKITGKWAMQHAECAIKYRGTDHVHPTFAKDAWR